MRKRVLAVALAGLALPALALAAQPIFIRVGTRTVPMHEVVRVVRTTAGPVRVHTWSWRGPNGAAMVQVSESRSTAAPLPTWAMAQLNALRAQVQQMRLIEAALSGPMMAAPPMPVMFGEPMLLALPGRAPIEVRFVRPAIPLRPVPQLQRVIVVLPQMPLPHPAAPAARHRGHLV